MGKKNDKMPVFVEADNVLPTTSFTATALSASAVQNLLVVHHNSRNVHIFSFVEGVFALLAFMLTRFGGYIVTMLMSAVGYVGAKNLNPHLVGVYAVYSTIVVAGNVAAFAMLDPKHTEYQKYAFMTLIDALINAWVARSGFRLNAALHKLYDESVGVTRELVESAPRL